MIKIIFNFCTIQICDICYINDLSYCWFYDILKCRVVSSINFCYIKLLNWCCLVDLRLLRRYHSFICKSAILRIIQTLTIVIVGTCFDRICTTIIN